MELFIDMVQYTKNTKERCLSANGRVDLETRERFPKGNVWKISKEWSGYESSSLTVNCIGVGASLENFILSVTSSWTE